MAKVLWLVNIVVMAVLIGTTGASPPHMVLMCVVANLLPLSHRRAFT
jgi:hypothetical protein